LTEEDDTYSEGEIKSQTQTTEINERKWKSILRREVLDVIDRTDENGKPSGRKNMKLYTREWTVAHPNMTSKLPKLSDAMNINIGRIPFQNQFVCLYLNANANFAGLRRQRRCEFGSQASEEV